MKRLAIIVPYNEYLISDFTEHFDAVVEQKDFYYKLVFVQQKSNRPINKGKLFNIGFSLMKNQFDYFCFHDIDFIPLSDFDYTYSEKPICLYSGVSPVTFGEHEEIDDYDDFVLVNQTHFGGSVIIDKEQFSSINGYSNEYWGLGYEDRGLLARLVSKGFKLRTHKEKPIKKSYGIFNGMNSYGFVKPSNSKISKTTSKSFSMSLWFQVSDFPPHGADVDNNRCEYFLFGRPGYHSGLSITHEGKIKGVVWDEHKENPTLVQSRPIMVKTWYHCGLSVDLEDSTISLYVDGQLVSKVDMYTKPMNYHSKDYLIGVGNPRANSWRNFCKGDIADVGLWDDSLTESEMSKIFTDGISKMGRFSTSKIPIAHYNFESGYDNIIFDMSGNNNHLNGVNIKYGKKIIKTSQDRYLPYRRNGYYGYIGDVQELKNLRNIDDSSHPEIRTNKNIFSKKINNFEENLQKDGLNTTRFRIVNRENYKDKHEIIQVVV